MTSPRAVPDGFHPSPRTTGLVGALGPVYVRRDEGRVVHGLTIDERHLNSRGFVHGAVIACLLDITLGDNVALEAETNRGGMTATLTVHYTGRAVRGDWLEATATATQPGRRLAHAQGVAVSNGRTIATASAAFAISAAPAQRRDRGV
jgi:uncharacterized protein (TIGR00369 family)